MHLFYSIWSDIINYQKLNGDTANWKFITFFSVSFLLSWNIITIFSLILFLTGYNIAHETRLFLDFFSSETATNILWAVLILFAPSMGLNYFLVFHNKKYERILNIYEYKKGKLAITYFTISVASFFIINVLNSFLGTIPDLLS